MQRVLSIGILVLMGIVLVTVAAFSLRWRMMHDAPPMLYLAYLIEHLHYVPYRDFFDVNTPGIYLVSVCIGLIFGYSDLGFRCADLIYLGAILSATWWWMKNIGAPVAWCGAALFGLIYLSHGPVASMQREYLLLLPVIIALILASSNRWKSEAMNGMAVGFFFGLAAALKPHAAIAFPLVLSWRITDHRRRHPGASYAVSRIPAIIGLSMLGFLLPALAIALWLFQKGALQSFFDIAVNYWPLYGQFTGYHEIVTGAPRAKYLLMNYARFGGYGLYGIPAAAGVLISFFSASLTSAQKRQVALLIGLAFAYSVYALLAGKFYTYHWLPFAYFMALLSSLCFVEQLEARDTARGRFPIVVFIITLCVLLRPPNIFFEQIQGRGPGPPKGGRVDEIAAYLKAHMRPGDKVQPLDWTGGAVHAMLIARAPLATPFSYDVLFYHHLSSGYIQKMRARFIESMTAAKPRFIIQVETDKPWVSGPDTSREFKELWLILDTAYHPVFGGAGYVIYERRPNPGVTVSF